MSTQSLSAVQSGGYTYLYDESTGKAYKLDSKEAASIFEGSGSFTVGDDASFTSSSADYACTDGKDDGKIGADEACVSAFKGIAKMVVSPITEALKGNFVPAAVAGAGALAIGLLGPVGVIGASVVGLVGGGVQLYNGITKANSAKTDGEAKQAFEEIGQGGFATVTSLLGLKAGTKQIKAMNKTGKMAEAQGAGKVKAYFEDLKANKTAAKAAKQEKKGGTNGTDDNPTEPPSGDDGPKGPNKKPSGPDSGDTGAPEGTIQLKEGEDGQFRFFDEEPTLTDVPEEGVPAKTPDTQIEGQMNLFDTPETPATVTEVSSAQQVNEPVVRKWEIAKLEHLTTDEANAQNLAAQQSGALKVKDTSAADTVFQAAYEDKGAQVLARVESLTSEDFANLTLSDIEGIKPYLNNAQKDALWVRISDFRNSIGHCANIDPVAEYGATSRNELYWQLYEIMCAINAK